MGVINADGLFNGERLARCSIAAQLHWPRLLLASDGFGRLEINYARIVGKAYPRFNPIPSDAEIQSYIQEYVNNYLLFAYQFAGQLWGQWDIRSELLPRYKTASDRRSPIPPEPAFTEWKQRYREEHNGFPKSFGQIFESFLHGGGVGVGVGEKLSCSSGDERKNTSGQLPNLDHLPFDTLDEMPEAKPAWGLAEKKLAFEEFWKVWPRRIAKAAAEKAFAKCAASPEVTDQIINAVRVQLPQLTADLKFCPYPTTWLNQKRYEDEPGESQPQAGRLMA